MNAAATSGNNLNELFRNYDFSPQPEAEAKPTLKQQAQAVPGQIADTFNNPQARAEGARFFDPSNTSLRDTSHIARELHITNHGSNPYAAYALGLPYLTEQLAKLDTSFGYNTTGRAAGHRVISLLSNAMGTAQTRVGLEINPQLQKLNHQNITAYNAVLKTELAAGKSSVSAHLTALKQTFELKLVGQQAISPFQLASMVDTLTAIRTQAIKRNKKLLAQQRKYSIHLTPQQYKLKIKQVDRALANFKKDLKAGNISQAHYDAKLAQAQELKSKIRYKSFIAGELKRSFTNLQNIQARLTIANNKVSWYAQKFKGASAPTAKQTAQANKAKATLKSNSMFGTSAFSTFMDNTRLTSFISKLFYVPTLGIMWGASMFGLSQTKIVQNILSMPILGDNRLAVASKTGIRDKTVETTRVLSTIGAGGVLAGLASKFAIGAFALAGLPALLTAGAVGLGSFILADKSTEGIFGFFRSEKADKLLGNIAKGKSVEQSELEARLEAINPGLYAQANSSAAPSPTKQEPPVQPTTENKA